ncbi:hypothetical protein OBBRIDRAFT_108964 [Obba rivulosa]|uniref:Uncharacterized protein n=1 Tax=Obba rivulosa TaxID=1052685 RepID=A0A8E2ARS1_9APHY|nr:hypothetical protein OBBRIDRAFT_108964 [Obba rivulosa]
MRPSALDLAEILKDFISWNLVTFIEVFGLERYCVSAGTSERHVRGMADVSRFRSIRRTTPVEGLRATRGFWPLEAAGQTSRCLSIGKGGSRNSGFRAGSQVYESSFRSARDMETHHQSNPAMVRDSDAPTGGHQSIHSNLAPCFRARCRC